MEYEFPQANACPQPGKDNQTEYNIGKNIENIPPGDDCKKA
jgi:hypothetical protein